MNWLLDCLVAWGVVAPVGAAILFRRKPVPPAPAIAVPAEQAATYQSHAIVKPHPRGGRVPVLAFGFTLDGEATGERIPADEDPRMAALTRSLAEGKNYGARRI